VFFNGRSPPLPKSTPRSTRPAQTCLQDLCDGWPVQGPFLPFRMTSTDRAEARQSKITLPVPYHSTMRRFAFRFVEIGLRNRLAIFQADLFAATEMGSH
jgi:hypothetical protein